jgi:NADPH:quinone reductase-like Zn-dependent oxidoreductase
VKAVTYTEYGGPEVLHVADVEEPHAAAGQIRIAVRAAGVNPGRLEGPQRRDAGGHAGELSRH